MMSGAQQGRLLHTLVRLGQATRVLEIGCFTGYATLWMAPASVRTDSCSALSAAAAALRWRAATWTLRGWASRLRYRLAMRWNRSGP